VVVAVAVAVVVVVVVVVAQSEVPFDAPQDPSPPYGLSSNGVEKPGWVAAGCEIDA
jgi:hypothetical protein